MTLCRSRLLQVALMVTVYFLVDLSTCSTRECGLQMKEEMKRRSVLLRNVDMRCCQVDCIEESYIFVSCHQSIDRYKRIEETSGSSIPADHQNVLIESCGSEVCNSTSQCIDDGCRMVCMEVPSVSELHGASKSGDLSKVNFILSRDQADLDCKDRIGRTPVMWAAFKGHIEMVDLLVTKGANLSLVDSLGVNTLHAACLGGDVEVVKYILSQDRVDTNGRVLCGRTPVMLAAGNGYREVVDFLVRKGAGVSLVDKGGNNILHCACMGGDVEVVKYIVSKKLVDLNSREGKNRTPLMVAGLGGHKGVVKLLVKQGANQSLRAKHGNNILHYACRGGHVEVVKYILSQKRVDIDSRGRLKKTPLMVACQWGHSSVVEVLVQQGANQSITDKSGNNILHNACREGHVEVVKYIISLDTIDINCRGLKNKTPVMGAAQTGHKDLVEILVKNGANLSLRDAHNNNILHLACQGGHVELLKYVLSQVTVDINSRGKDNRTPVMVAARNGHKDVTEFLVKNGGNLTLIDGRSNNILHHACWEGHVEVVKYVLSQDTVDINSRGNKNKTPVMIAGRMGHTEVVGLFLKNGGNLSLRDDRGDNILHYTCIGGHVGVVKYVVSQNLVDINSRGNGKKTPVMIAGERGHRDVVEVLVKYGANLSLRDGHSNNILHLACRRGHVGVVAYVLSKGTVDINAKNDKGESAATIATTFRRRHVLEVLLTHGANI